MQKIKLYVGFGHAVCQHFSLSFLAIFQPALGPSIAASVNESDTRRLPNYESPTAKGDDVAVTVQDNSTQSNNSCTTPHSEPKSANFVLLYILICIYSFLAITVTCHHYFVTSMSRICEGKNLS